MEKIRYRDIAAVRTYLLEQQAHRCGLCDDIIEPGKAVLDHDHRSGLIRRVLHRGCNSLLGKIERNMARSEVDLFRLMKMATGVAAYISNSATSWIHPTFKTAEERQMKNKIKQATQRGMGRGKGKKPPKR